MINPPMHIRRVTHDHLIGQPWFARFRFSIPNRGAVAIQGLTVPKQAVLRIGVLLRPLVSLTGHEHAVFVDYSGVQLSKSLQGLASVR